MASNSRGANHALHMSQPLAKPVTALHSKTFLSDMALMLGECLALSQATRSTRASGHSRWLNTWPFSTAKKKFGASTQMVQCLW